jgi:hypothetical protein
VGNDQAFFRLGLLENRGIACALQGFLHGKDIFSLAYARQAWTSSCLR